MFDWLLSINMVTLNIYKRRLIRIQYKEKYYNRYSIKGENIPIFGVDKISFVGLFCLIAFIRRAGGSPAPGPAAITGGTPG